MGKWYLSLILIMGLSSGCLRHNDQVQEKTVEMTIYPEVGYGAAIMSQTFTEVLIFSESDDRSKRKLVNIGTDGFDFDYKRGYEYTFKAKKVWMSDPPQDASSIKYVFIGSLNKKKVITEDSETIINITIQPHFVSFRPRFSVKNDSNYSKVYEALFCQEDSTKNTIVLTSIGGFDYEEGYTYKLKVKKIITANPYSKKYVMLDMIEKKKV